MHFALAEQIRYRLGQHGYHDVADQVFSRKSNVCEYFRLLWGGGNGDHCAETLAVGSSARGYLAGQSYMNLANGSRHGRGDHYRERVPREEIRSSRSPSEYAHRFRVMYRWYMGYWFDIDVRKRLEQGIVP